MSRRTKKHCPFLLKFNRHESFHNPPSTYNSQSRSVQFFFFAPARILNVRFGKNQSYLLIPVYRDGNCPAGGSGGARWGKMVQAEMVAPSGHCLLLFLGFFKVHSLLCSHQIKKMGKFWRERTCWT